MPKINVTENGEVTVGDNDSVRVDIPGGGAVTISADPNDDVDKIRIEFRDDSHSDYVTINLSSFDQDDLRIDIHHYDPSDSISLLGALSTWVDPNNPDEYQFTYLGADGEVHTGFIRAKDGGEKDFTDPFQPIQFMCFGDGTLIATPKGEVPIEMLQVGDLVLTRDSGPMPIRWIGRRHMDGLALARAQYLRPIAVRAGALGDGLPVQDLILSPNHRVLLTDWRAEYLFGEAEVLVAIKALVNDHSILWQSGACGVTYNHILLDSHEVLLSNGLPAESLMPGPMAMQSLDSQSIREIHEIFPELCGLDTDPGDPARAILKTYEGAIMGRVAA